MAPANLIDVYVINLEHSDRQYKRNLALLNTEEQQRAFRFKFERHRHIWAGSRAALREILSRHSSMAARDITFTPGRNGKPKLLTPVKNAPSCLNSFQDADSTHVPLHFNLSHSGQRAIVAVSCTTEIGCDIEHVKPIRDWAAITRRFFSKAEQNEIERVREIDKQHAFYVCWTRKEAVIKATGEGLSADLSAFDVSLSPGSPARVYAHRSALSGDPPWQLINLELGQNYVGAVALKATQRPTVTLHSI